MVLRNLLLRISEEQGKSICGGDQETEEPIPVEKAGLLFKDLKIIPQPSDSSFGKMGNISLHRLAA